MATYNNPWAAQLADGLVKLFAPPAPQEMAALTQMQIARERGNREGWLFNNPNDPTASRRSALVGIQGFGDTPEGFGMSDATDRYGYDTSAATSRANNTADNARALEEAKLRDAATRYGVDVGASTSITNNTADNARAMEEARLRDAATRYGVDVGARTSTTTNAADNERARDVARMQAQADLAKQYIEPRAPGVVDPGLPGSLAQFFGLPAMPGVNGAVEAANDTRAPVLVQTPNGPVYMSAAEAAATGAAAYIKPDASQAPPASVQEYQFARQSGFTGTFDQWLAQRNAKPDPLVQVLGANGQPQLVPQSQAAGMTPFVKPDAPQADPLVQVAGPNGEPIWVRQSQAAGQQAFIKPDAPREDPLVQVLGANGQPQLVPRSQAAGMTPFIKPDAPREDPLVQVTGPDGNPIWVPRSQAAGRPAYVKPDAPRADPLVQALVGGQPQFVPQSQAAGMTPYEQPNPSADRPVQVVGPDGKPIWVPGSQANGLEVFTPRSEEYGTTPIFGRDAAGNVVIMQAGKNGTVVQSQMPPGIAIDFSVKPFETARGTELGQQAGEAAATAPMAEDKTQTAVSLIDSIITDKALPGITGMFQGRLPPMTQAGTDLNAKIDQLTGQAFLEAFNTLRGGGQITEVEGRKATDAMARLSRAQSPEAYVQALNDMKDVLLSGMARRQQKAMMGPSGGVGGPQPPQPPAPPAPATPAGPQPGAVMDGYRFLGGDPSNPASWEAVQ